MTEVAQSCLTLCNPIDCSLTGSSFHRIFQARILEWVAISISRGSSWPRNWTQISHPAGRLYHLSHQGKPRKKIYVVHDHRTIKKWDYEIKKIILFTTASKKNIWEYINERCAKLVSYKLQNVIEIKDVSK